MHSTSLPERILQDIPGSYRQVIVPPDGDLMNPDVAPIDTVVQENSKFGPAIRMGFKLTEEDLEYLRDKSDGVIMLTMFSNVMPIISMQVY